MPTGYQIGVTEANMVDLETLELWPPISDWTPNSGVRTTGTGAITGTGRPVFTWKFNLMTITEMGALLYYLTDPATSELQASRIVYARTRISQSNMTERVFQSYRARMLLPFEPQAARYDEHFKYHDVVFKFVHGVAL